MTDETDPELDAPNDTPPADVPPKRGRPRKNPPAPPAAKQPKPRPKRPAPIDLASKLTELLTMAGLLVGMANTVDGLIISNNAANLAGALDRLANENDNVRRVLTNLVTGSAWGGVIVAAGSIALPIAANHGVTLPMADAMLAPYKTLAAPPPAATETGAG